MSLSFGVRPSRNATRELVKVSLGHDGGGGGGGGGGGTQIVRRLVLKRTSQKNVRYR